MHVWTVPNLERAEAKAAATASSEVMSAVRKWRFENGGLGVREGGGSLMSTAVTLQPAARRWSTVELPMKPEEPVRRTWVSVRPRVRSGRDILFEKLRVS